jgi:D-alanine-D-alanine ligase
MKKIRVMVLYGGRSGEHEISLRSAASVIRFLDTDRFEVVPVAIDKQGRWLLNDISLIEKSAQSLPVYKDAPTVVLPPNPGSAESGLIHLGQSRTKGVSPLSPPSGIDVVFPVMHGPLCEDGTIQGLFELADVPYVGCGVLASAVGMDKEIAKRLVKEAGLPIVPYIGLKKGTWERNPSVLAARVEKELKYPVFVKPATLGSSVGVHKVKAASDLDSALKDAFRFDTKVLIEKAVQAREIELAVLEDATLGNPPLVSIPGEIVPTHEFYSYEAKYLDEEGAKLLIPAKIDSAQVKEAQRIACEAFELLECEGLARVDLFLDKVTGEFYFNEVNTIPGFTSISMYPKLWEHSGISYKELLSRLIDLAIARHGRKKALVRDYLSDEST